MSAKRPLSHSFNATRAIRETAAEAHAKRPDVTERYLLENANKKCPRLHGRVLTAIPVQRPTKNGRSTWAAGFLPRDLDDIEASIRAGRDARPDRLTVGEAFRRYRHVVESESEKSGVEEKVFATRLRRWRDRCPWLEGPLDAKQEPRTIPGRPGTCMVWTYHAEQFATIDARRRAQRAGVWFRTDSGQWLSGEEISRGGAEGHKVEKFLTAAEAFREHGIDEMTLYKWGHTTCVYLRRKLNCRKVKTYAARGAGRGYEVVYSADDLAKVVQAREVRHESTGGADDMIPESVAAADHGLAQTSFRRLTERTGVKRRKALSRVGQKLAKMYVYRRGDIERAVNGDAILTPTIDVDGINDLKSHIDNGHRSLRNVITNEHDDTRKAVADASGKTVELLGVKIRKVAKHAKASRVAAEKAAEPGLFDAVRRIEEKVNAPGGALAPRRERKPKKPRGRPLLNNPPGVDWQAEIRGWEESGLQVKEFCEGKPYGPDVFGKAKKRLETRARRRAQNPSQ